MLNSIGRPTAPTAAETQDYPTFTGNKGLQLEQPLLFEIGRADCTGVDFEDVTLNDNALGKFQRDSIGLVGLSEPEAMRHYVRLSQKNYSIDAGLYPLGSCTMKHNPRLNEKMARLAGFSDIHPLQPISTVQGALQLMDTLSHYLLTLTGMEAVALSPKAGAHGEMCGMMAIKAALIARGEAGTRTTVLVPISAHGTNPATAAQLGFTVRDVPARADGTVCVETVKSLLDDSVAAIMLTNPNTCGLFEREVKQIADAVHEAGGYFYCDGANFNAIVGKVKVADLGVDAMHINLHKTFSTPHGGGGPGSGPVVLSPALAKFAPVPFVKKVGNGYVLIEHTSSSASEPRIHLKEDPRVKPEDDSHLAFGRMVAFHGQTGMYVRALTYMLSHGADGMRQASEDAVLNANYIKACLQDLYSVPFDVKFCMHEALFDDRCLNGTGLTTLDLAKAMIDEGYHPMTMYFPLVVHGAMLIEPTESESLAALDLFIATMRDLMMRAQSGNPDIIHQFKTAPHHTPRARLDETRAARSPKLRWNA